MSEPLVTIIVVTLNCAESVGRTLQSIVAQSARNVLELVVVDGKSEDGTVEAAMRYSPDRIVSEKDTGIYDAMNKGVSLATGRYCWFINAGDEAAGPDVLERLQAELAGSRPDLFVGRHAVRYANDMLAEIAPRWPARSAGMPFSHQAALYRTALLREFPFDTRYRYAADYDQFVRIARAGAAVRTLDWPLAVFEAGGVSDQKRLNVIREWARIDGFRPSFVWYIARHFVSRAASKFLGEQRRRKIAHRVRLKTTGRSGPSADEP